jgi:hypothetical protein
MFEWYVLRRLLQTPAMLCQSVPSKSSHRIRYLSAKMLRTEEHLYITTVAKPSPHQVPKSKEPLPVDSGLADYAIRLIAIDEQRRNTSILAPCALTCFS